MRGAPGRIECLWPGAGRSSSKGVRRTRATLLAASVVVLCIALVTAGALVGHLASVRATRVAPPPARATPSVPFHIPQPPAAHRDRVRGVRVSHLHGRVPWPALARASVTFAFARASAGSSFVDPEFAANWEGMREAGVVRGAYHVWRDDQDARAQAERFLATVPELSSRDLPPALVLERDEIADAGGKLAIWLEYVQAALGRRPVLRAGVELPGELESYRAWRLAADGENDWRFGTLADKARIEDREAAVIAFAGDAEALAAFIGETRLGPAQRNRATVAPQPAGEPPPGLERHARGVQVARYQGRVNWPELERARIAFALIGATGGRRFIDPEFASNWNGARELGIARGAYHVFYADEDPRAQAEHFVATVGPLAAGDLPGVLVVPRGSALDPSVLDWLTRVEEAHGKRPILRVADRDRTRLPAALSEHPLWVVDERARNSPPGQRWSFWRYSDAGTVPGIAGDVPLDVFRGSAADLATFVESLRVARVEAPAAAPEREPAREPAPGPEPEPAATPERPTAESREPAPAPARPAVATSAPPTQPGRARTHRVRRGETLYRISRRYGVTVEALMSANGIDDPTTLAIGQTLAIP